MLQTAESLISITNLLDVSNPFYQDLLGYKPEQTSLKQIPKNQWDKFVLTRGFNPDSSGIYFPRNQTVVIQEESPLSLFHEYFGHGLYCEQSLAGRKLVDLEKKLLEEEKQEFQEKQFTLEDLQKFRKQNKTFQELNEHRRHNLMQYELFAIWTEYLLSREFDLRDDFGKKYDSLENQDREIVDSVIDFSEQYGDLATFYAQGLAKIQDKKRLLKLSQNIFRKSLNHAPLLLHFGSGKQFSDVDLFVVSNDIEQMYDHWIDVRSYKIKETWDKINVLDSMVTDPIMVGKLIWGNEEYLNEMKRRIINQPITEEAINFNFQEYKIEKNRSKDASLSKHLQDKNLRSAKTYLTNALALRNGKKILTFKGLVNYSHTLSHSGKFIELKGGIE